MTLNPGTRLGPYEVSTPLGAGGMGEVYRARDTRLGRDVAIKVLPVHLSDNPEVRARFEREAKTISSLNHPNICMLFDVGREGEVDFIVMELIEGGTLAERLQRGPLPAAELLRYATQIADALDRAHRAGVVHRDLKPGNVMLTKNGAKLMDFGLSRVAAPGGAAGGSITMAGLSQSPTVAPALTTEGSLLGTFQYMAPEQLEGKEADVRSDIWAFGCVLYEMATGRRAFEGRSQASLIAAILEREPAPVGEAPSGASGASTLGGPPAGIDRLIRNCLAKDPEERIQTAHDIRLHLQGIAEGAGLSSTSVMQSQVAAAVAASHARGGNTKLAWGVAALAGVLAVGAIAWAMLRPSEPPIAARFRLTPIPEAFQMFWPRVSPNGKFLLVEAVDSTNVTTAYVRPMNQIDMHPIPGTERTARVYWSPDGNEVAFVKEQKLQRVVIAGGSPVTVCAAAGSDLSWGSKGFILMDGKFTDSLLVVPAGGGELKPASRIDRAKGEIGSAWPCFLPDGEHFLFIGNTQNGGNSNIRLGKLGSLDSKVIGHSDGRVEYGPGGWVLFVRGTSLLAQKLDLGAAKLTGEPVTLADQIRIGGAQGHFSVSNNGILAFSRQTDDFVAPILETDRTGKPTGQTIASGTIADPRVAPDGSRVLFQRSRISLRSGGDIYIRDLARGTEARLTFTEDRAITPVWSPDGSRFAYVIRYADGHSIVRIGAVDGLGLADSIPLPAGPPVSLRNWMADGRLVAFSLGGSNFAIPTAAGDRIPQALVDSTLKIFQGTVSPDGRWMAGVVGVEPSYQIVVVSLTGVPGRWQVSSKPGIWPRWSKNGKELLYESWARPSIMAVDIDTQAGFRAGTPQELFILPVKSITHEVASWDVDATGEKFYVLSTPPRSSSAGIVELDTRFSELVNRK